MNRKIIIIGVSLILLLILFVLFFLKFKPITIEQAKSNFKAYENQLKEIAANRGFIFKVIEEEFDDSRVYVITNDKVIITIDFHIPKDEKIINDYFSVSYYKEKNQDKIDVKLFLEIINAMSKVSMAEEYCINFLEAPEEKYPAREWVGRPDDAKIYKVDFLKNYFISYSLRDNNMEELYVVGKTKNKYYIN